MIMECTHDEHSDMLPVIIKLVLTHGDSHYVILGDVIQTVLCSSTIAVAFF
jgi:hypothetical protein